MLSIICEAYLPLVNEEQMNDAKKGVTGEYDLGYNGDLEDSKVEVV